MLVFVQTRVDSLQSPDCRRSVQLGKFAQSHQGIGGDVFGTWGGIYVYAYRESASHVGSQVLSFFEASWRIHNRFV